MKQINIGIMGLGTVGSAVADVLQKNSAVIAERAGVKINVKAGCDLRQSRFPFPVSHTPDKIISDPDISVVVETMGGVNPAKGFILAALKAGKHVVTSNKELIALHMDELLAAAQKSGVALLYEGAVGGGIPIINTLRDNLAANRIDEVYGIVNGTTNYILSKMTEEGWQFSEALQRAKEKGFAEANPKNDIEGYDASYKAMILAASAFGTKVRWQDVYREGIDKIGAEDILYAGDIGYVIKLLAIVKRAEGQIEVRVHPALVAQMHPLASVSENFNAIYVKGFPVGELMFYGPGAGGEPTASAVIGDIIYLSSNASRITHFALRPAKIRKIDEITSRFYVRLRVPDKAGVLAGISRVFADHKVSIAAVFQKEKIGNVTTIVMDTHEAREGDFRKALAKLKRSPVVKEICSVIRIL